MLREKWEFGYSAAQLSEATAKKLTFHQERLAWWKEGDVPLVVEG